MSALTQDGRFISIETSLGKDAFLLYSFACQDYISKPFEYQLELIAEDPDISPNKLIGKQIDIALRLSDGAVQFFNGHVKSLTAGPIHISGHRQYHAEIIPWFSLLGYISDCRIFQNMDVKAIVEEVFSSRGHENFEMHLQKTYCQREYTVQYSESDLHFVSRLLEEEGIFYFHVHEKGKHTLIIADDATNYKVCTEDKLRYFSAGRTDDHLDTWNHQYSLISGKTSLDNYNFTMPATSISVNVSTLVDSVDADKLEIYDYPGYYATRDEGDLRVKARIEEQETQYEIINSSGTYRSLQAGRKFTLDLHEIESEQGNEYVITSVDFFAKENSYDPSSDDGGHKFTSEFQCIPANVVYRPPVINKKPKVFGNQTAIVVGPSGEEIYTDEYGRIKVQFHWDRVGEKNENSSCWLRVGQQMAGKQWGAIFIPRIGHEVIVGFLEGDPDQPMVTGCVYNADNMPPYELPANKTQSGWKTRSSSGGSAANYNEIKFEDKMGSESISIHAQKDATTTVKNNRTTTVVGGSDTLAVQAGTQSVTVQGNTSLTVNAGDRTVNVTGNYQLDTTDEISMQAPTKITLTCGGSSITLEPDKITISAGGGASLTLDENALMNSSAGSQVMLDSNALMESVAGDQVLLDGKATMSSPAEATVEAPKSTLSGGGSTTVADKSGIALTSPKISLNG